MKKILAGALLGAERGLALGLSATASYRPIFAASFAAETTARRGSAPTGSAWASSAAKRAPWSAVPAKVLACERAASLN